MKPSLVVDWHVSATDIAAAVWRACFAPATEGAWWYTALERSRVDEQFAFSYATLRRGEEVVGIVPTFVMDLPLSVVAPLALRPVLRVLGPLFPSLRSQRTLFVGSPCSEHGMVGLRHGVRLAEVLPDLQAALESRAAEVRADMLVWKDMPTDSATDLRAFANASGLFEVPGFPGTVASLAGGSFEGHLAGLSSQRRYKLRKKLSTSRAAVDLAIEVTASPTARQIDEIFALYLMTWEKATVRFEKLTREFFCEMAVAAPAHFVILRESSTGRPVAFMLFFYGEGAAINKFIGIDATFHEDAFLYFRLWEEFVRAATAMGATTVSSGQTSYRPKLDLGHELTALANFSKHFNPLLHRLYAAVGRRMTVEDLDTDLKTALTARRGHAN